MSQGWRAGFQILLAEFDSLGDCQFVQKTRLFKIHEQRTGVNAMTKILAVALLTTALAAHATVYQATDRSGTTVSLHAEACANQRALQLLPKLNTSLEQAGMPAVSEGALRAAEVLYQGKAYGACWVGVGHLVVVLDDGGEDTSIFVVPARDFTAAQGI